MNIQYKNIVLRNRINRIALLVLLFAIFCVGTAASEKLQYGIPGLKEKIAAAQTATGPSVISIPKGEYHFLWSQSEQAEHYISNHQQTNPRYVGINFENLKNVTFDANGSTFWCHGKMLPIVIKNCENCTFRNFSIDFATPSIVQVHILKNGPEGITMRIDDGPEYEVRNGTIWFKGEGFEHVSSYGIAFDGKHRNLIYNTADISVQLNNVKDLGNRTFLCPNWKNDRLVPGTVVATRCNTWPAPGIFMYLDKKTNLKNINIHYAEGKAVLAQLCDTIVLDKVSICQRGPNDTRYFTAHADATHFSGCKGNLTVENCTFEAMMDDAINVHGTYLKVTKRIDKKTLQGSYAHGQSWGFLWGTPGDDISFINAATMETIGEKNVIESIRSVDKPTEFGAKVFEIKFKYDVPDEISEKGSFGIENLTWAPEVVFRNNVIRNNRARGTLFSTPKKTLIEGNLFEYTSGTAILLCGDCNGWYETGACRDVVIRGNRFHNTLTSMFQFTNAIISIYPEIPQFKKQVKYFHGGREDAIIIEDNIFETFDRPIVYAKSLDGLTFRRNTVITNDDFKPFHWNQHTFLLEKVKNFKLENNNSFDWKFDPGKDILQK